MQKAIAYYRVSTARQGRSGLGIEAQRKAVTSLAAAESFELIGEFVEVETGRQPPEFSWSLSETLEAPSLWLPLA